MAKKRDAATSSKKLSSSGNRKPRSAANLPMGVPLPRPDAKPHWDRELRELWLGKILIHRFHRVPTTIGLILDEFERLGWQRRIDDPLRPIPGRKEADRLRGQINAFNRRIMNPLIQFRMDGSGEGIRWEPV